MSTLHTRLSAMSMVEVMIACTVLVVGIGAGMGAIGNSGFTSNRRQNVDKALAEIQSQIESFQAMDDRALQALFASGDTVFYPVPGLSSGIDPETKVRMSMPLKVQRVAVATGTVRLTTLRFVVSWHENSGPAWVEQFFHYTERR